MTWSAYALVICTIFGYGFFLGWWAREIKMRERCYPRWVRQNRMTETEATRELERMRAVLHTLQELADR